MFTGIIEEIGVVRSVRKREQSASIEINAKKVLSDIKIGDSINTNGVCLTVTDFSRDSFTVDVVAETFRMSNLGSLATKMKVNLERALRMNDRLGGHIVSGHIDGTGKILGFKEEGNAIWVTILPKEDLLKYIIYKGSIAIDGISLTVAYIDDNIFKVALVPHTKDNTTLLRKKVGDDVNLECDLIGKYIEKFMVGDSKKIPTKKLDMDFLQENGFI